MNSICKILNLKKYSSYILYMVLTSVSYAQSNIKSNEESLHKILNYSFMISIMNTHPFDNNYDSVSCKTSARIIALKNEIIKNADPQSLDAVQDMIEVAHTTNKECNSKESPLS